MTRGINKVILIGNLGQDPEVRYTPNGHAVANTALATNTTWRDKQTGTLQERTEWHRVAFFGRLAEIVGEYLRKGSKVYIEGSLRTRKWQDKNNSDRYTTEIVANEMHILDNRNNASSGGYEKQEEGRSPVSSCKKQFSGSTNKSQEEETLDDNSSSYQRDVPELEDDIPF